MWPGFFFSDYSKMQEERDKLRKELLRQKKPALDGLRNLQPIQIAKSANVRRCTVRKAFSGEKPVVGLDHILLEEITCVNHGFT